MTCMEEETQMQPEMTPLEEHANQQDTKEIHPSTRKWMWFIIIMIVILVSFGIAWFIMQEHNELESELDSGSKPQSEILTKRALQGIGKTLSEAKDVIKQNGDAGYTRVVGLNRLGIDYTFEYPMGWHVIKEEKTVMLNDLPMGIDIPQGAFANIFITEITSPALSSELSRLVSEFSLGKEDVQEENVELHEGFTTIKLTGKSQAFGNAPDDPYTQDHLEYIHYVGAKESPERLFLFSLPNAIVLTPEEFIKYSEQLDHIVQTFELREAE